MADPEVRWIDSFLGEPPGVAPAAPGPTPSGSQAGPPAAPSFGGSDLIGIGYLTGPEPDEVREQVTAAFGIASTATAGDPSDLWR